MDFGGWFHVWATYSFMNVLGVSSSPVYLNATAVVQGFCISESEVKMKFAQSYPTLCNLIDYTVHGILQARILEWIAIPFSRESSQPRDWIQVSHITGEFFTNWGTKEAQEYWSG